MIYDSACKGFQTTGLIMTTTNLSDINRFKIADEQTGQIYLGYDQEWYGTPWQRLSGGGPTTACNILRYMTPSRSAPETRALPEGRANARAFMDAVWEHVTPTNHGVATEKHFYTSVLAYASTQAWSLDYRVCHVSADRDQRPAFSVLADFLEQALKQDIPVAFLNLCNGEEANLDEWHWVTIIAMTSTPGEPDLGIQVLDCGVVKQIDLTLWYQTTTRGGGFVTFSNASAK